MNTTTNRCHN